MPDVSFFAAFGAGFLSFISPCVLPLIPGYISYISGMSLEDMRKADAGARRRLIIATLFFILGFSLIFMAMGASASAIGKLLLQNLRIVQKIAGSPGTVSSRPSAAAVSTGHPFANSRR